MRKAYHRPRLYAEVFQLTEHISQSCGMPTNFGTACPITDGPVTFFTSTEIGCSDDGINMIRFAGYENPADVTMEALINTINPTCYNSFSEYHQLFTSA